MASLLLSLSRTPFHCLVFRKAFEGLTLPASIIARTSCKSQISSITGPLSEITLGTLSVYLSRYESLSPFGLSHCFCQSLFRLFILWYRLSFDCLTVIQPAQMLPERSYTSVSLLVCLLEGRSNYLSTGKKNTSVQSASFLLTTRLSGSLKLRRTRALGA